MKLLITGGTGSLGLALTRYVIGSSDIATKSVRRLTFKALFIGRVQCPGLLFVLTRAERAEIDARHVAVGLPRLGACASEESRAYACSRHASTSSHRRRSTGREGTRFSTVARWPQ